MDDENDSPDPGEVKTERELTPRERSNKNLRVGGGSPRPPQRLNVLKLLAQHNYNPVINMIEQLKKPNLSDKVRADLNKELLSYAAVKPRFAMEHEVASKNADTLGQLLDMISSGGHQPPPSVTVDARPILEATIVDGEERDGDV